MTLELGKPIFCEKLSLKFEFCENSEVGLGDSIVTSWGIVFTEIYSSLLERFPVICFFQGLT